MKGSRFIRILALAITFSLLILAIPATPALAAATVTITNPVTAAGPVGTTVTLTGTGFTTGETYTVTFGFGSTFAQLVVNTTTITVGTAFTTSFSVPAVPRGTYTIRTTGSTSGNIDTVFTVTPSVTLSATSGYVAASFTVTGSGFSASTTATIYFDTTSKATPTTSAYGGFTATTITVPETYAGSHTVKARDSIGYSPDVAFTILPKITASPASGAVGAQITVTGTGFAAASAITFYWDNVVTSGSATTNANGTFTNPTFAIPTTSRGSHTLKALDASANSATYSLTVAQKITITPTSGAPGTEVTVNGTGFTASQSATIRFNAVRVTTSPASIPIDTSGSFSGSFNVSPITAGSYAVYATDGSYNDSTNFAVVAGTTLSEAMGNVGSQITFGGSGFRANSTVTISYDSIQMTTTPTDAYGAFSATFDAPASTGGNHAITATDGTNTATSIFAMETTPPAVPTLALPANDTKSKSQPTFTWQPVSDPSGVTYTFQIATDANFAHVILEKPDLTSPEYTLIETEKLESVGKDTPYYWRVKAIDGASNESEWSTPNSFYVGFIMPTWGIYALFGFGALLLGVLGFWLGRRTAYR